MSASTLTSKTGYMSGIEPGIEPLTGTNFSTWRDQVKLTLGVMDLDHALRIDPPAALTAESTADQKRAYEQWERSNRMSLMIIKNSISVAIRGAIPDSENAKEYLSSVEEQFKGTSKAHASTLILKMLTTKYDGVSGVREHIMMMSDMANKLKGMDMEISEGEMENERTDCYVWQEEERLKVEKPDVVHVATTNSNKRKSSWKDKGSSGDNSTPNKVQKTNASTSSFQGGPKCKFCHKKGHIQKDCPKFKEWLAKKGIFESFMINKSFNINVPINSWWIDSGSMVHIANSLHGFRTIRRLERNQRTVKVGNGVDLNVETIGTLSLILEAEVENHLNRRIKVVRSDKGGEYYGRHTNAGQTPGSFFDFCKDHEIINQYTMPERSKGYRFYCPSHSTRIVETRHAEFLENANNSGSGSFRRIELQEAQNETPIIQVPIPINTPLDTSNDHLITQDHPNNVEENEPNPEINVEPQEIQQLLRRSQRNRQPTNFDDYYTYLNEADFDLGKGNDPESFEDAITCDQSAH
ncbi:UBN2_2 domain-containing protein [Tanacetum coccineum]